MPTPTETTTPAVNTGQYFGPGYDSNGQPIAGYNNGQATTPSVTPGKIGGTAPSSSSPIQTTTEVRNEFNANSQKLGNLTAKANGGISINAPGDGRITPPTSGGTTPPAPTTTTPTTTTPAPTETESEFTKTQREIEMKRKQELDRLDVAAQERQKLYDDMMAKSDVGHQNLLTSIKTQFDQTRAKMVDTNSRFNAMTRQNQYLVNGLRYTPQQAEGMIYDTEQYGLTKLADLDSQFAAALTAAQTAKDERDYKNLGDLMNNLDTIARDRLAVLNDMARGAKELNDSLNTVENMNSTQITTMNNMMEGFGIDLDSIPADQKEEWYKQKALEISEATGTTISAEYVKSQMSRYNKQNQLEKKTPDVALSSMFGFYVNQKGEPITGKDGKPIHYSPNDKTVIDQKTGQMIIVGVDDYGSPTIQTIDIPGWRPEPVAVPSGVITPGTGSLNVNGQTDLSSLYTGNNGPAFANNNPGNIKDTKFGGQAGGKGGFTKFASVEEGIRALLQKLEYNKANGINGVNNGSAYNGNMTLQQYFAKYAPSGDGNNPNAYAQAVAGDVGASATTQIKDIDTMKLAMAIMKHENGAVYQTLIRKGIIGDGGVAQTSTYSPDTDPQLKAISGDLFMDSRSGKLISFDQAQQMYGGSTPSGKQYSAEQIGVMDSIIGEPTKDQRAALAEKKLTLADIENHRKQKRASGDYSVGDQTFISTINGKIEKNDAYKKANTAQTYINNVLLSLDRNTGLGDIAAVNQFQKIIDEGAVTRDQDIKLVQSAESLIGKLAIWMKNKQEGDVLSAAQRQEIKTISKEMLDVARKSFENDPVVKARKKELELRGINPEDTVFGEFSSWQPGTGTGGSSSASDPLGIL